MTDQQHTIGRLESWLGQDDGSVLSERVMDSVIAELASTRQVGTGWSGALRPSSPLVRVGYAVAGVAAAILIAVILIQRGPDNAGGPSPTAEPTESAAASATPGPTSPGPPDGDETIDGVVTLEGTTPRFLADLTGWHAGLGPNAAVAAEELAHEGGSYKALELVYSINADGLPTDGIGQVFVRGSFPPAAAVSFRVLGGMLTPEGIAERAHLIARANHGEIVSGPIDIPAGSAYVLRYTYVERGTTAETVDVVYYLVRGRAFILTAIFGAVQGEGSFDIGEEARRVMESLRPL